MSHGISTQYTPFIYKSSCTSGAFNMAGQTCLQQGSFALTESAGATTIDWSKNASVYTLTLNANLTITFTNAVAGQVINIILTNTASNYTVTWGTTVKWPVQVTPVLTTGNFSDVYTILNDGSAFFGTYVQVY